MYMIDIDYQTNYKDIIDYTMDNRLNLNSINTILSIADAKIKRQMRLDVENVRYVIDLFNNTLKAVL